TERLSQRARLRYLQPGRHLARTAWGSFGGSEGVIVFHLKKNPLARASLVALLKSAARVCFGNLRNSRHVAKGGGIKFSAAAGGDCQAEVNRARHRNRTGVNQVPGSSVVRHITI